MFATATVEAPCPAVAAAAEPDRGHHDRGVMSGGDPECRTELIKFAWQHRYRRDELIAMIEGAPQPPRPQREPHAQTDLICIIALPINISHRPRRSADIARSRLPMSHCL